MIQVAASTREGQGARLTLRPPRALTARQFVALFAVLAGTMWAVAGMAWFTGNVFGPVFALIHSALLGASLRWLWFQGERDEVIVVSPEMVEVRRSTQPGPLFRAHPYWVQLRISEGAEHVALASSGKRIEVGAFLGPAERQDLAGRLQDLLGAASGRTDDAQGSRQ
jgi:uncharacterized membrane protein